MTPKKLERLRREAKALARLEHPSLVGYSGMFEDAERALLGIVMELVDGQSLGALLGRRRLDERMRTFLLCHVAEALAHIHERDIVHRDVKLDNVLVTPAFFRTPSDPKTVKLIDFGIAVDTANPQPLTRAGHVIGTVPYLAPEQIEPAYWQASAQSAACDVFAFGILAWRLLSDDASAHPADVGPTADLDDYAIAYRRAEHDRWPSSVPNLRYASLFRKALALRASERIEDGVVLSAQLTSLPTLDDTGSPGRRVITIPGEPPLVTPVPVAPTQSERTPRPHTPWGPYTLLFLLGALIGIGVAAGYLSARSADDVPPPPQAGPEVE